jgi:hypothetical protein
VNDQDRMMLDLARRVQRLERGAVRVRVGEVTGTAPLDVALGGADESYEDVKSVVSGFAGGETVAVIIWGGDMIVLGEIV